VSPSDDLIGEMFGWQLEDGNAKALLEGRVEPDDAPPGLQEVAELVLAARSSFANGDLAGESSVVPAFIESVRAPHDIVSKNEGGTRMLSKFTPAKVLGLAAALAVGGATAAAATGSLPGAVQSALSRNLSHLGLTVPNPGGQQSPQSPDVSNAGHGHSTNANAPTTTANQYGLCTAYAAVQSSPDSSAALNSAAFMRLAAEAQAKGDTVQEFCATVTKPGRPSSAGSDQGTSTSTNQGGQPSTTPAGNTPGSPPATTPSDNTPGTPPATTPLGNAPGAPPASTPAGNTPGQAPTSTPPTITPPSTPASNAVGSHATNPHS
jgi:hypothetical protein